MRLPFLHRRWPVVCALALLSIAAPAPAATHGPEPVVTREVASEAAPDSAIADALRFALFPVEVGDGQGHGPDPGSAEWHAARRRLVERACRGMFSIGDAAVHRYTYARVDLDGDDVPEVIATVLGPVFCGTGGCPLFVFRERDGELALVSRIGLFRDPLIVAETRHHGWKDLVVRVREDAGNGYYAALEFDGTAYPANPSVEPARPLTGPAKGIAYLKWQEDGRGRHVFSCRDTSSAR